ncbi:hypothetical protein [Bacillus sp. ISTL8]|nr:hypothetical protein [Bacillus sp. ISTL8]
MLVIIGMYIVVYAVFIQWWLLLVVWYLVWWMNPWCYWVCGGNLGGNI